MGNSKKYILIAAAVCLILFLAWFNRTPEDSKPAFNFRKANWGMSAAEVKQSEAAKPKSETEEMILYHKIPVIVGGAAAKVKLVYGFSENQLVAGCYGFNTAQKRTRGNLTQRYFLLKRELQNKYGEPSLEKESRTEDKNSQDKNFVSIWNTADAVVELKLKIPAKWLKIPSSFDLCYTEPKFYVHD